MQKCNTKTNQQKHPMKFTMSSKSFLYPAVLLVVLAFHASTLLAKDPSNLHLINSMPKLKTIVVDQSQHSPSSFRTIQSAIDSISPNNKDWICIDVKRGVYIEQVTIPENKSFIYIKGEGVGKTNVSWNGAHDIIKNATFISLADDTFVTGISFVNSYNYPQNGKNVTQAVAVRVKGDRSAFYLCSFSGVQDTLFDEAGKHYFKECTIEGAIDFIFGNGQSIYQKCTILVNGGNYITAHGRGDPNSPTGFVFRQCVITGNKMTFLGRGWFNYARVIFYQSFMSKVVDPRGWSAHDKQQEITLTFVEEQCKGPGSNKSMRVGWEKTLKPDELTFFTSDSYIDEGKWLSRLPIKIQD